MSTPIQKKTGINARWLAIGVGTGVAIGIASNNLALWLPLGVAFGCIGSLVRTNRRDRGG